LDGVPRGHPESTGAPLPVLVLLRRSLGLLVSRNSDLHTLAFWPLLSCYLLLVVGFLFRGGLVAAHLPMPAWLGDGPVGAIFAMLILIPGLATYAAACRLGAGAADSAAVGAGLQLDRLFLSALPPTAIMAGLTLGAIWGAERMGGYLVDLLVEVTPPYAPPRPLWFDAALALAAYLPALLAIVLIVALLPRLWLVIAAMANGRPDPLERTGALARGQTLRLLFLFLPPGGFLAVLTLTIADAVFLVDGKPILVIAGLLPLAYLALASICWLAMTAALVWRWIFEGDLVLLSDSDRRGY
jgi:hypothetical protein